MATQLAKKIARTPLSDPMSGFFIMRQEIFAAIDAPELLLQGYKILLYLHARAVESIGSQVRLGEVGYEFGERHCGQKQVHNKSCTAISRHASGICVRTAGLSSPLQNWLPFEPNESSFTLASL